MPIDGKGFGVVATRELFIGERLLAETPLLVTVSLAGPMVSELGAGVLAFRRNRV